MVASDVTVTSVTVLPPDPRIEWVRSGKDAAMPRMVVVDSDAGARAVARTVGEATGWEVREATTVDEARTVCARFRPDVGLVDPDLLGDEGQREGARLAGLLVAWSPSGRPAGLDAAVAKDDFAALLALLREQRKRLGRR